MYKENRVFNSTHLHDACYQQQADRKNNPSVNKTEHLNSSYTQGFYPNQTNKARPAQKRISQHTLLRRLFFIVLLALLVYAAIQIAIYCVQTVNAQHQERTIQELIAENEPIAADETDSLLSTRDSTATVSPTTTSAPAVAAVSTKSDRDVDVETTQPEVLIQFNGALATNPDTIGQLCMGESINTYVVQRDNTYYLRHSFYNEYSISGAIFLDVSCSIYPQSRNLILHGHNMQNGTAFGKLLRFKSLDYRNEYPVIRFDTLYQTANYTPFAAVYYSIDPGAEDYLNIYQVNYLSDDAFIGFIQTVKSRSIYHLYINVAKTDKILTTTTCTNDDPNMRFAVFAVETTL